MHTLQRGFLQHTLMWNYFAMLSFVVKSNHHISQLPSTAVGLGQATGAHYPVPTAQEPRRPRAGHPAWRPAARGHAMDLGAAVALSTHRTRSCSRQKVSFMGTLQIGQEVLLSHDKHQHILPVLQTAVCLPGELFPQTSYIHFSFTLMRRLLSTHWFSGCPLTACQASLYTKYLEYANDQVKIEATCLDVTFYSHLTPFLKRSQMLQNENCTFLVNTERMIYADRHSLAICHR